jgi:hypothetical protein
MTSLEACRHGGCGAIQSATARRGLAPHRPLRHVHSLPRESIMSLTTQLSPTTMADYFTRFTKRYLVNESTDVVDVEVLSPSLGDQVEAQGAHLLGITYEPKGNALELELDAGDVRTFKPKEVWVVEEDNGFLRALEIVREDDTREIIQVRRLGVQRGD